MKLSVEPDAPVRAILAAAGVEFPCGGMGTCGRCRIRLLKGTLPITPEMERVLTPAELADGWRLACCAQAEAPLMAEIGDPTIPVLSDDVLLGVTHEQTGITRTGAAIDLGTTTLA